MSEEQRDDKKHGGTPRTDAEAMRFVLSPGGNSTGIPIDGEWVHADFARQLERELTAVPSAVARSEPQGTTACSVCGIDTPHYHDIDAVNRERVIERAVRPAFEKRYTELARAIPEIRVSGWVTGFQRRQETDEADPPEHPSIIPGWYDRWSGDSSHPMKGHYKNPTVEGMWRMWLSAHEQATVVQSASAPISPPTEKEIAAYRDLFRSELDKNMHNSSGSPSTDAHHVALHAFIAARNATDRSANAA